MKFERIRVSEHHIRICYKMVNVDDLDIQEGSGTINSVIRYSYMS